MGKFLGSNSLRACLGIGCLLILLSSRNDVVADWKFEPVKPVTTLAVSCGNASVAASTTGTLAQSISCSSSTASISINCFDANGCDKSEWKDNGTSQTPVTSSTGWPFNTSISGTPGTQKAIYADSTSKVGNKSSGVTVTIDFLSQTTFQVCGNSTSAATQCPTGTSIPSFTSTSQYLNVIKSGGSCTVTLGSCPAGQVRDGQNPCICVAASTLQSCGGVCTNSNGIDAVGTNYTSGVSCNISEGVFGKYAWDGVNSYNSSTNKSDYSNCNNAYPYCYTCQTVGSSSAPPPPTSGINYGSTVRQMVNGPLLWGYVYKDSAGSASFTGNNPLDSFEGANALPQLTTPRYPSGTLTGTAPNLLRGRLVYTASYSGQDVNPPYNTRTFSFASLPTPTAYQMQDNGGRVFLNGTTSTTGTDGFVNYADYFPVSGMTGLMYVDEKKSGCNWSASLNSCNGGSWTEPSKYYTVSNKSGSCAGGCTLQPVPVYSSFTQSPSALYTLFVSGSCSTQNTYSGYACNCNYTLGTLASCTNSATAGQYSSKFSFCPTNCVTSVQSNTCSESCSGPGYSETAGWDMFEGSFDRTGQSPTYAKKVAYGFKKTGGITHAKIVYQGLQISTPKNYLTDIHSGNPALFDDWWTNNPGPSNPYCRCEQDGSGNPNCFYGWYCAPELPPIAGNEYRVLPPGKYLFKIPSTHALTLTSKVNGTPQATVTASPDGSGNLNFYFDLSGAEGSSVELELSTSNFTNPNNLPAVTVGAAGLYALGLYEITVTQDTSSTYNNWCSSPLSITNKPSTYPIQLISRTTDSVQCGGAGGGGFVTTNQSTSVDTFKVIQADILLEPTPTISGRVLVDNNNNNCASGATGYNGATVNIVGATSRTVTTNSSGDYSATNLAVGGYTVSLSPILGYQLMTSPPSYPVTLPPNKIDANFCIARTYSVSGLIFDDKNQNGTKDQAIETGTDIAGSTRADQGGSTKGLFTRTTPIGSYRIDGLLSGNYLIYFVPQGKWRGTTNSGNPISITIGPSCSTTLPGSSCLTGNIQNLDVGAVLYSPWLQTTGGDVHSNEDINVPGGP